MGRNYWGDIEGKFWFGIQSSDDPSYFKEPCSIEEDEDGEETSLVYSFDETDVELLEEVIDEIVNELGDSKEKLDRFLDLRDSSGDDLISKETGILASDIKPILTLYARMKLGNQILDCIRKNGQCIFECEL